MTKEEIRMQAALESLCSKRTALQLEAMIITTKLTMGVMTDREALEKESMLDDLRDIVLDLWQLSNKFGEV